jgi:hypothetical protein
MNYNSAWCLFHSSDVLLKEKLADPKSRGVKYDLFDEKYLSSSEEEDFDNQNGNLL